LKKETSCEVVVYTAANGVQAAWAIHLYCPGKLTSLNASTLTATSQKPTECKTDYHNNFTVYSGEHTYYEDVPLYVQVGEESPT